MNDANPASDPSLHERSPAPTVRPLHPPQAIPVFNCVVMVARPEAQTVVARVGNLAGIEVVAPTEREALSQAVTLFKQRVTQLTADQQAITWCEVAMRPGEVQRLIAVHL